MHDRPRFDKCCNELSSSGVYTVPDNADCHQSSEGGGSKCVDGRQITNIKDVTDMQHGPMYDEYL